MHIMWCSDNITATSGYAGQGRHLLPMFQAAGHQVAHFAWRYYGAKIKMMGIPVYPCLHDDWGNDSLEAYNKDFKTDLTVFFGDIWVLPENYEERACTKLACYFPIDHQPIGEPLLTRARKVSYPIQYSQFGSSELARAGVAHWYIPHGIDTHNYTPRDKQKARKKLKLPEDAYIFGVVAHNVGWPARKAFPEIIMAFSQFLKKHKDAILYLHTNKITRADPISRGIDFPALIESFDIPKKNVWFVPEEQYVMGLPESYLADAYNAIDVLLSPSYGEGFGLPLAEAQACGTPVITNACSAMTENTINGIAVPPLQPFWTPYNSWWWIPDAHGVYEAMETIFNWPTAVREGNSQDGIQYFADNFDFEVVVRKHWLPFLAAVEGQKNSQQVLGDWLKTWKVEPEVVKPKEEPAVVEEKTGEIVDA